MRLFTASLATESNSFSPIPTNRASYEAAFYYPPGKHPDRATPHRAALRRAAAGEAGGIRADRGLVLLGRAVGADARRATTRAMRDEILDQLRAAMPVDGVLLGLHGAMIAYGYDDAEGDILERVRAIVGPKAVIGVELDPHCHLTEKRVRLADVDHPLQGIPAHRFRRACRGAADDRPEDDPRRDPAGDVALRLRHERPVPDLARARPLLRRQDERPRGPGRRPLRLALPRLRAGRRAGARHPRARRHRQRQGEGRRAGEASSAKRCGRSAAPGRRPPSLSTRRSTPPMPSRAGPWSSPTRPTTPAAAPPPTTPNIIRRLMERGCREACVGPVWDPMAVQFCMASGVGATFALRFGGKAAATSGKPIDAEVTVIGLKRNGTQSFGASQRVDGRRRRHPHRRRGRRGLAASRTAPRRSASRFSRRSASTSRRSATSA